MKLQKNGNCYTEELEELLEQMAEIQDALEAGGFYLLDMKIEEATWSWN